MSPFKRPQSQNALQYPASPGIEQRNFATLDVMGDSTIQEVCVSRSLKSFTVLAQFLSLKQVTDVAARIRRISTCWHLPATLAGFAIYLVANTGHARIAALAK